MVNVIGIGFPLMLIFHRFIIERCDLDFTLANSMAENTTSSPNR